MNRRPRPYQGRALPTELPGHSARAGDGNRTRDVQLGRLMLYQLSYSRRGKCADGRPSWPLLARCPLNHSSRHFARGESRRPESNRRPADYKSAALPSELRRPVGSSPANVVVCCSTGFRLRHPCYGKRLSPVRCVPFGTEADVFEQAISWFPGAGPDTASQVRGSERKNARRKPPFEVYVGQIAKQHAYHRDRGVSIR